MGIEKLNGHIFFKLADLLKFWFKRHPVTRRKMRDGSRKRTFQGFVNDEFLMLTIHIILPKQMNFKIIRAI